MTGYTREHAESGRDLRLPAIETWENQYERDYEISIECPEYTSICPKTRLPDFGVVTIAYIPKKLCLELKSLKVYLLAYRNVGIFYENAINRICDDLAKACKPKKLTVTGVFNTRGGMRSTITARYP
ncbi:MAG TPA: preQ(1) synthase [Planctomycetota bacterium]|nr:preQ(1) synthase [Planctomycetota bacterium]